MKRLTQFVIGLADLAEAEGRALRKGATMVAFAAAAALALALLALAGAYLMVAGVFLWLELAMGPAGAAFVTGLGVLALVGVLAWITIEQVRSR